MQTWSQQIVPTTRVTLIQHLITFERAVFSVPDDARDSARYTEGLTRLVETAEMCGKILNVAPEIVQPLVGAATTNVDASSALEQFVSKLLSEPAVEANKRDAQKSSVDTLVQLLSDLNLTTQLLKVVEMLLRCPDQPAVWLERENLFLIYRKNKNQFQKRNRAEHGLNCFGHFWGVDALSDEKTSLGWVDKL